MVQAGTTTSHKHHVLILHYDLFKLVANKLKFLFNNIILLIPILWYVGTPIIRNIALAQLETTIEAKRQQSMTRKWKRMLLPKLYKQKCRVCGNHNFLCDMEQTMECHNCGNTIRHGESQTNSIGMDNFYVKDMVELYNENANIWQLEKLVNYNFSKNMKDA